MNLSNYLALLSDFFNISYWPRPSVNATLPLSRSHSIHRIRSNSLLWLPLGPIDNPDTVIVSSILTASAWTSCVSLSFLRRLVYIVWIDVFVITQFLYQFPLVTYYR